MRHTLQFLIVQTLSMRKNFFSSFSETSQKIIWIMFFSKLML